ncbi:MAG: 4Fe-4S binding protein, partial [Thermoguttaceae bacterium]|nr:4Fe-4S binding protein [Thermoguttaceae bacterium]
RCVSCGTCTNECPKGAIRVWKGRFAIVDPLVCIGCGKCKKNCPADCIELKSREGVA